ncbi:hydroxyethylthiazole kinase [Natroniella acetigena]|uniref:hydroxyethylthiazole kinase n=1 Tax=Natroniella acetigena TaxID=52004 RepID=UPI00200A9928|nr:hydroxyethylthiazole kinase [Natroniella acetigena]MCK8827467.1 hydroxyethylthiazole kinase [Natroniella acetigena]
MDELLTKIKDEKPLVHHITNNVTVNDCANITLYWGGLPVMAYALEEVAEMVEAAAALVLNIGTLQKKQVEAMLLAGKRANQVGVPIILDPVGVGATAYRTKTALELLDQLDIAIIKGNQAEIITLAGEQGEVKGVESIGQYQDIVNNAKKLAHSEDTVVVVSGEEDIVTSGNKTYKVQNGDQLMGQIVGTGCMLASTLGVFCGVSDDYLQAALTAITAYGIAGEKSAQQISQSASYKVAFFDAIGEIRNQDLIGKAKIKEI